MPKRSSQAFAETFALRLGGTATKRLTHVPTAPDARSEPARWTEVGRKLKGPVLRGLAARAPYFHNGSAATLGDVVNFYDQRFGIGFTAQQKTDLINFLNAL